MRKEFFHLVYHENGLNVPFLSIPIGRISHTGNVNGQAFSVGPSEGNSPGGAGRSRLPSTAATPFVTFLRPPTHQPMVPWFYAPLESVPRPSTTFASTQRSLDLPVFLFLPFPFFPSLSAAFAEERALRHGCVTRTTFTILDARIWEPD